MIQLHQDYLLLENPSGESIPCSVESAALELVGNLDSIPDIDLVKQAAAAVLHYFKHDLGRDSVSIGDFSMALERVLDAFGIKLEPAGGADSPSGRVSDLKQLACDCGKGFELAFFPHLREVLRKQLSGSPRILEFQGLRGCVKQLLGAKRWSSRCQILSDQIVDYLRECFTSEDHSKPRGLLVR